jgi:hypothetical protein
MAVMRIVDLRSFIIGFKQMWAREVKRPNEPEAARIELTGFVHTY